MEVKSIGTHTVWSQTLSTYTTVQHIFSVLIALVSSACFWVCYDGAYIVCGQLLLTHHTTALPTLVCFHPLSPSFLPFLLSHTHMHTRMHTHTLTHTLTHRVEWKETARWVKFEEDVEEGGNKWSKPHVATLSLHSLFELRSCILKGTVILNMEASDLGQIAGGAFV